MPKFAANLSMMFQDMGFLDRFDAAAKAGFKGVEFLFPYDHPPEAIAERLERNKLTLALFNLPPGDWSKGRARVRGDPGTAAGVHGGGRDRDPLRQGDRRKTIHAMAGLWPEGRDKTLALPTYIDNLRWAADRLAPEGITAIVEPINTRDIPGYYLNTTAQAMPIIEAVDRPNLRLQLDLYHVQIMEGDLAPTIRALAGNYPHVQIAGNPGRHEPDIGEIHYPYLFDLFDEIGYAGWIGCEYRPEGDTVAGLGWAKRYGIG